MKPTRGIMSNRIGSLTRERRTGLIALSVMLIMSAALLIYQRLTTDPSNTLDRLTGELPIDAAPIAQEQTPPSESLPAAAKEPVTRLANPLGHDWQVVKEYGSIDQAFGDFRIFSGLAVAAAPHTVVQAGGPGRVVEVEHDPLDGGTVVIDHGSGLQSRYAGMGQILVQVGQEVDTGQDLGQIAISSMGVRQSLGSHLYLQVFKNGHSINPVAYFPN